MQVSRRAVIGVSIAVAALLAWWAVTRWGDTPDPQSSDHSHANPTERSVEVPHAGRGDAAPDGSPPEKLPSRGTPLAALWATL